MGAARELSLEMNGPGPDGLPASLLAFWTTRRRKSGSWEGHPHRPDGLPEARGRGDEAR